MSNTYFNISDKLRLYEFDGMLDKYGDATAAYSLRKLRNGYTGNAIRVRRSSDDTERDMGFYDNELDTVALLDWVNADIIRYTSDFSVDNQGWSATGGTSDGNIDGIDGQDDCLRLTADTSTGNHRLGKSTLFNDRPNSFRIELDYYIPSTNIDANSIRILTSGNNTDFLDALDAWTSVTLDTGTVPSGYFYITMYASGTNLFTGNGSDVIYVKNIRVTQTTSSGFVQTWYDQSANANHAVQNTDTAQPKIVDAGTLVTVNDKPAVLGDGVDDFITSANVGTFPSPLTVTTVYDPVVEAGTLGGVYNGGSHGPGFLVNYANGGFMAYQQGPELTPGIFTPNQSLMFFKSSTIGIDWKLYINSVEILNSGEDIGVSVGNKITLFSRGGATQFSNANIQEFIVYGSDKTLDRTTIEANINNHYNIY